MARQKTNVLNLVCASAANLFLVLDDALVTPSVASGSLPGTVRELIATELAPRMGVAVVESGSCNARSCTRPARAF